MRATVLVVLAILLIPVVYAWSADYTRGGELHLKPTVYKISHDIPCDFKEGVYVMEFDYKTAHYTCIIWKDYVAFGAGVGMWCDKVSYFKWGDA